MDQRIRNSRELAAQLAHAKSIISNCRQSFVRLDIEDGDYLFITLRIARMISDLEIMKKKIVKDASVLNELQAVNDSKNAIGSSSDFDRVRLGGGNNSDTISSPANAGESSSSSRNAAFRKLA